MIGPLGGNRVSMKLIGSDAVLVQQLVRHQSRCGAVFRMRKLHAVHDRNILNGLMRDVFEHLLVRFHRYDLHHKMVLRAFVVCDAVDFKDRDGGRHLFCVRGDLIEDGTLLGRSRLIALESWTDIERGSCSCAFRLDGDTDVGFTLQLVDLLDPDLRIGKFLLNTGLGSFKEFIKVHHRSTPPQRSTGSSSPLRYPLL